MNKYGFQLEDTEKYDKRKWMDILKDSLYNMFNIYYNVFVCKYAVHVWSVLVGETLSIMQLYKKNYLELELSIIVIKK